MYTEEEILCSKLENLNCQRMRIQEGIIQLLIPIDELTEEEKHTLKFLTEEWGYVYG